MKKVLCFSFFMLVLCFFSSVKAQTIVWVSEWNEDATTGSYFDKGWIDILESQGYNVIADASVDYTVLNTDKIATLDSADLVIISRNTNSGGYIDGGEITQWNSIDSPLILFNPYLTRTNRWQWINSNQAEEFLGEQMLEIVDTDHEIFKDISTDNGQVDVIDETVNEGLVTFVASNSVGNGTVLAKRADDGYVWIAEWEAGTEFYPGTTQKPVEKRMLFAAGGSAQQESGSFNLTDDGKKIFLNSVSYMLGVANKAKVYYPANNAQDVEYNPILSWIPGISAETHNVFFGVDYNDVRNATISEPLGAVVSEGQALDANTFDPGNLEFGTRYYWRVDEVSSEETFKGKVWSFTVEKEALDLPFAKVAKVTAISSLPANEPNDTINGFGLGFDPNFPNQHSNSKGLWASSGDDGPNNVWIQYDFDKKYKIHSMQVWNYNHPYFYGFGFKEVLVQCSDDAGVTWSDVPDINEFAVASGKEYYDPIADGNNYFELDDVIANSIRITALSNYKPAMPKFGLSEVRFSYVPLRARKPSIADEAENVAFDASLEWRKGREAVTHELYFDTNETNVEKGIVASISLNDSMYSPDLSLGNTYYWRVDEVNTDKIPSVWQGDVWEFSVPSTILIDGFETGYGDDAETNAVFQTWKDSFILEDNDNGSWMGRNDPPYLHVINHSGGHSAPMSYDNTGSSKSEVVADTADLLNGSDWSLGNPKTLTIWFRGDPNVTEVADMTLYCKIGSTKKVYTGSLDTLTTDIWRQWDVDLSGMNLSNVSTFTIGIENNGSTGSSGTIYLDDIMLTGEEPIAAYPDIIIEAEDYDTISGPIEVNDVIEDASGGQYIHVINGTESSTENPPTEGIVTYDVDLDGGQYIIWGRVIAANADTDSFWFTIDGAESDQDLHESGWCRWNSIPAGTNWHWDDVHSEVDGDINTVTWTIPAGTATIRIAYRESSDTNPPKLDALLIQKVGE